MEDIKKQLEESRLKQELIESQIKTKMAESTLKELTENLSFPDAWASLFADRLDRFNFNRSEFFPTTFNDRRYGRNIPIYATEQELALLRASSRLLAAVNTYCKGYLSGLTSYVISEGFDYIVEPAIETEPSSKLVRACQRIIDDYFDRNRWRGGEGPSIEEETFLRSIEDGEFFLVNYAMDDGSTELRFIEPEQVTQPPGEMFEEWGFGIHTDPLDHQRVLGYYVCFGPDRYGNEDMEFDASDIIHFKRNVKRGMKRGIPDLAYDTRDAFDAAGKLRRNMGVGAAIQAAIVAIREHDAATQGQVSSFVNALADFRRYNYSNGDYENLTNYNPGTFLDVGKNMKYQPPPGAQNAQQHVAVLQAVLRSAAVLWNAPEWLVNGDASNSNFSSSLSAESQFVKTVKRERKKYEYCYKACTLKALENWCKARGGIAGYRWNEVLELINIKVKPPQIESKNQLQDAQVDQILIEMGVKDRQTACSERGLNFEKVYKNNQEYDKAKQKQEMEQQMAQQQAMQAAMPQQPGQEQGPAQEEGQDQGGDEVDDLFSPIEGLDGEQSQNEMNTSGEESTESTMQESILESRLTEAGFTGVIVDKAGRRVAFSQGKRVKTTPFKSTGFQNSRSNAGGSGYQRKSRVSSGDMAFLDRVSSYKSSMDQDEIYSMIDDARDSIDSFTRLAKKMPRNISRAASSPTLFENLQKVAAAGAVALLRTMTVSLFLTDNGKNMLSGIKTSWRMRIMEKALKAIEDKAKWTRKDSKMLWRSLNDAFQGDSDLVLVSSPLFAMLVKSEEVRKWLPPEISRKSDDPVALTLSQLAKITKMPVEVDESMNAVDSSNFSNVNRQY